MKIKPTKYTPAFTLIELLIVVLIIAILAAIAVPNFLEFQTRAKIARAKSDMRSTVTAIEAYAVDNNVYPLVGDEDGDEIIPYPAGGPPFEETRLSVFITTPVAFITQRLNEPFPAVDAPENKQFHYSTLAYAFDRDGMAGSAEFMDYAETMFSSRHAARYYMLSHGPDLDHDETMFPDATVYDPSNGTVSSGDIIYFGPGLSFPN